MLFIFDFLVGGTPNNKTYPQTWMIMRRINFIIMQKQESTEVVPIYLDQQYPFENSNWLAIKCPRFQLNPIKNENHLESKLSLIWNFVLLKFASSAIQCTCVFPLTMSHCVWIVFLMHSTQTSFDRKKRSSFIIHEC